MKNKSFFNAIIVLVVLSLPLLYQNCASEHGEGSLNSIGLGGSNVCETNLIRAFTESYQPFLRSACIACHDTGGESGIYFAQANPQAAWTVFMGKGDDKINEFATGSHKPGYTGPQNQSGINKASSAWAPAEAEYAACLSRLGSSGGVGGSNVPTPNRFTTVKSFTPASPQGTALNGTPITMSWDIGTEMLNTAHRVQGVTVTMQIRAFNMGGATGYEFRLPRLINTSPTSIYIRGIAVKINNTLPSAGTTFYLVDRYVPNAQNNNSRGLSANGGAIIYASALNQTLNIQLGFTELRDAGFNFAPVTYQQLNTAGTGTFQTVCLQCHGQNGGFQIGAYANIVGRIGNSGRTLVTPFSLENSHLYQRVLGADAVPAQNPMPPANNLTQAQKDQIRDWILDGAPNTNNDIQR